MNFCPCLQTLLGKLKGKKKAAYEGHREFEEEEFINPNQREETSLIDTIAQPKKPRTTNIEEEISSYFSSSAETNKLPDYEEEREAESQSLNIKLELNEGVARQEREEEKDIEQLIQEELLLAPADAARKVETSKERTVQNSFHFEDYSDATFTINIDPIDPHFAILHEKTSKLTELLAKTGPSLQLGSPNRTNLRISEIQNSKASTFVLSYRLNCSYSYYLSLLKNDKILASLSPLLAESKTLESYKPNLTLNTLKFRRLKGFEPRDCFYVKYQNGGKCQHWEVYINDETAERSPNFKTCEMFCAKSFRQASESELDVVEYLEVDLGSTNVGSILPKLAAELLNFLNALSEHIARNYEQELV